jgi:DNA-binding NarL/FixJ family response regulator
VWSFELLDAAERSAFARLAVFTGAFSRDGAHAVAEANTQVLAALTAKSMIHPVASRGGATRYRMLETIQAFALEQLADAAKPVRERHLEWWISRAERSCGRGLVPVSRAAFDAVYQDIDDLRSALRFAIEHAPRKGLRLIATTRDVWHKAAQSEGLERALRLLEVCPEQDADRGWGLVAGGRLAMVAQDHELAQRLLGEAVAIARREREPRLEALARWLLGISLALSQRLDESALMARSALDLFRAQSDEAGEGRSTSLLGFVAVLRGDLAAAPELLEQALAILTAAGDVFGSGHCHWYLALLKRAAGDLRAAEGHLREAIELLSSDRDVAILGMALAALAQIEVKRAPRRALVIAAAAAARHRVGGRYGLFGGDDIEHVRAAAISAVGPGKAEQAWREGSRLLFDEAATLALRQTAPRRSGDRGGLSRREFEVAELVASGLTNAEVAATLHLAQRTVENHVAHALAKLGLRNRTELAARLGELAPS